MRSHRHKTTLQHFALLFDKAPWNRACLLLSEFIITRKSLAWKKGRRRNASISYNRFWLMLYAHRASSLVARGDLSALDWMRSSPDFQSVVWNAHSQISPQTVLSLFESGVDFRILWNYLVENCLNNYPLENNMCIWLLSEFDKKKVENWRAVYMQNASLVLMSHWCHPEDFILIHILIFFLIAVSMPQTFAKFWKHVEENQNFSVLW